MSVGVGASYSSAGIGYAFVIDADLTGFAEARSEAEIRFAFAVDTDVTCVAGNTGTGIFDTDTFATDLPFAADYICTDLEAFAIFAKFALWASDT